MKTYAIWKQDDFFQFINGPRIDMDPLDCELPADEAPIVWGFNWDAKPVGIAHNIRLEAGEILCEVEWHDPNVTDEFIEELECRLGGYYTSIQRIGKGDHQVITQAKLRGVSLMLNSQTPGWRPPTTPLTEG